MFPNSHSTSGAHPPSAVPPRLLSLDVVPVPVTLSPDVARLVTVLAQIERRRQLRRQLVSPSTALQEAS